MPFEPAAAAPTYRIHRYPSVLIDRLMLPDGRTVTVRPVLPQDAEAEQAFVATLSPEARRLRFHLAVNALPEALLRRFTEIDYRSHLALVAEAEAGDDEEPRIVADARYAVEPGARRGDFAIAVADDWRGLGLGIALMQRLGRHARRQGLDGLCGDVLPDNLAMRAMIEKLGGRTVDHPHEPGLLRACLDL